MINQLAQLEAQQALFTDALARMVNGQWTGFPSLEGDLLALDPGLKLHPRPPLLTSEAGPEPPPSWWQVYDPHTYMPPQAYSWSCSACSLAWVERATGVNVGATEDGAIVEIGYPENINPTYGLMSSDGRALRAVLEEYGLGSSQGWLTFDQAYAAFHNTTGMLSGGAWYHWVGVRGIGDDALWIANSAPGYQSVWDVLDRHDYERLGPMSCVWLLK